MRVVNKIDQFIGYRLNLLGVRVYRRYAQLVARSGDAWVTNGRPRDLPFELPGDVAEIGSDTLLLTIYQYDQERPGSDLMELISQRKDFDQALSHE